MNIINYLWIQCLKNSIYICLSKWTVELWVLRFVLIWLDILKRIKIKA